MAHIDEKAQKAHSLGNMLMAEGKVNEAIKQFEKAIELAPEYDAAIYHLAEAFEAKKLEDESVKQYMKAIKLNNSYAMIHIDAGLDSLLSGPLGKAVAEFKKTMPGSKHAHDDEAETQLAEQSSGEIDTAKAKKGIAPKKFTIEAAGSLESVVDSCDTVKVRVMGERDIPIADVTVTFNIVLDDSRLADAALGTSMAAILADPKHRLAVKTDGSGAALIFFKRSMHVGRNILSVSVQGLADQQIDDITVAADVAKIKIDPVRQIFTAAETVNFTVSTSDRFGNPVADREVHLTISVKETADWFTHDSSVLMTGKDGTVKYSPKMPTASGVKCKLQALSKESDFRTDMEFTLISGKIGSTLYIPMKGRIEAGKSFALKVKLLDEHDNAVIGKKASIKAVESSGGEWKISPQGAPETGEDGAVFVIITSPGEIGAKAVFSIEADGLDPAKAGKASFETVEAGKADTVHTELPAPKPAAAPTVPGFSDEDLDMIPGAGMIAKPVAPVAPKPAAAAPAAFGGLDLDLGLDDPAGGFGAAPAFGDSFAPAPADDGGAGAGKKVILKKDSFTCMPGEEVMLQVGIVGPDGEHVTSGASAVFEISQETSSRDACFVDPDGTPTGNKTYTFKSDGSKYLSATVQAPTAPGKTVVSIVCAGTTHTASINVASGAADKITVTADQLQLMPGETTGLEAVVLDAYGNPLPGQTVYFIVKEKYGRGGEIAEPSEAVTDDAGVAKGQYVSGGNAGDRTIVGVEHETVLSASIKCAVIETLPGPDDEKEEDGAAAGDAFAMAGQFDAPEVAFPGAPAGKPAQFEAPEAAFPDSPVGQSSGFAAKPPSPPAPPKQAAPPQRPPAPAPPAPAAPPAQFAPPVGQAGQFAPPVGQAGQFAPPVGQTAQFAPPVQQQFAPPKPQGQFAPPAGQQNPAFRQVPPMQDNQQPFQPPRQPGGIEFERDALPVPEATQGAYDQFTDGDIPLDGPSTDELIQMLDPYAPPKFEITRGKKPVMELSELLPKVLMLVGIIAAVGVGIYYAIVFSKSVRFKYNETKANDMFAQNRTSEAIKYYETCIKISPEEPKPYIQLGEIYYSMAEASDAADESGRKASHLMTAATNLNTAINLEPDNADALFELGRVYKLKGDKRKALEMFKRTLRVDPRYGSAITLKKEMEKDLGR